jgi:hypothetical protein
MSCLYDNQTKTLEYYSAYTERQLTPCVRRIAQLLIKTADKDSKEKVSSTVIYLKIV